MSDTQIVPTIAQVAQMVRNYLQTRPDSPAQIEVVEQGVHQEEGWWHVPVRPDVEIPRTYQYYDLLADVETEILDRENIHILLVPSA